MIGGPPPHLLSRVAPLDFPSRCCKCNARTHTGVTDGKYTCGSKWVLLGNVGHMRRATFRPHCQSTRSWHRPQARPAGPRLAEHTERV